MAGQAERLAAKLRRGVANATRALALQVNRELRLKPPLGTPVMDGNARANWIPSAGHPYEGEAQDAAGGNAAAAQGEAQVAAWELGQGDLFVTNRTPYIRRLNDGYSRQSPALFVETAIERAKTKVNQMLGGRGSVGGFGIEAGQSAQDVAGAAAENLASAYSPFGGSDD